MSFNLNRYDQPAQAQFVQTYVPIPFEELLAAGQAKQNRYDKAAAATDAVISRAEMINAIPGSPDDMMRKKMINDLYNIRDKYVSKDLSDPFVQRELSNEIRSKVDPVVVKKMEESYNAWVKAQEAKRALAMNNKWNPDLDEDPALSTDSTKSVYNYSPRAFVGLAEMFEPYYKDIKPDSLEEVIRNGHTYSREFVSDKQIEDVTRKSAQELASTQYGQDHIKLYKKAHPNTDLSDVEILQQLGKEYGMQKRYSNYQILPNNVQSGGPTRPNLPTRIPNISMRYGENAESNKPKTWSDINKELNSLSEAASKGDIYSKNRLEEWKDIESGIRNEHEAIAIQKNADSIKNAFETAVGKLRDLGVSEEEIYRTLKPSNISGAVRSSVMATKAGMQDVGTTLKNMLSLPKRIMTKSALTSYGVLKTLEGVVSGSEEDIKKAVEVLSIAKDGNFKARPGETKESIVRDYARAMNEAADNYSKSNKELEEKLTNTYNALGSNQETYTIMNIPYEMSPSGKIQGVFTDENGNIKHYDSAIGSMVTDFILDHDNYQNELYNVKGQLSRLSASEIKQKLENGERFVIKSIDDEPDEQGNVIVNVKMLNPKKSSGSNTGKEYGELFKIHLPMDMVSEEVTKELSSLGLTKQAHRFNVYPYVKKWLESNEVYSGNSEIPLKYFLSGGASDNDVIQLRRDPQRGPGIVPVAIINGREIELISKKDRPVTVNQLPQLITEALYQIESLISEAALQQQ